MPDELLVAVLAAGASRRLGQPKQLVEIGGEKLLRRTCRIAVEAEIGPAVAVIGCAADECASVLSDLPIELISNPGWSEGLAASIRCATRAAIDRRSGALLLLHADQYRITSADIRRLAKTARVDGEWSAMRSFSGAYKGPPVIFPRNCFDQLLAMSGDAGGREIFSALPPTHQNQLFLDHASADLDLPEELLEMNRWSSQRGSHVA